MKKTVILIALVLGLSALGNAQPEFYSDAFLGLPEFRALPLVLPTVYSDSIEAEVHVRIVYDDLQFIKKGDGYEASYSIDVTMTPKHGDRSTTGHADRKISVENYSQTNSRVNGDQSRFTFILPRDKYRLRIDVSDRESKKSRVLEKEMDLTYSKSADDLKLGDIVLLDSLGQAYMTSGILQGQPIKAAYRLYAKNPDSVSLHFQLRNSHDDIVDSGTISLVGSGPIYTDTLVVPTDSLGDTKYQLFMLAKTDDVSSMRAYPFDLLLQNLPSYIQNLEMAIVQLKFIATDDEYRELIKVHPSRRESAFRDFWKKKDPTPATTANEKMEEYYRRVNYANKQFNGYRGGWESDMGHVYIVYGAPTDIERHPFDVNTKPYEIWYYYDINRKFIFQDREGFGEYRLVSNFWEDY